MARPIELLGLAFILLAFQCVVAQDVLGKMMSTDVLLNGAKRDAVHSHLQRMLQMDASHEEPEGHKFNAAKSSLDTEVISPGCQELDCAINLDSARKAVQHGPMTQESFERMAQRKRASLREELVQKTGSLSAELDAFLTAREDGQLRDGFGIPLPVSPSADKSRSKSDPATTASIATTTTTTTTTSEAGKPTALKVNSDTDMKPEAQSAFLDPAALRKELEDFIASASPTEVDTGALRTELEAFLAASPALHGAARSKSEKPQQAVEAEPKAAEQSKPLVKAVEASKPQAKAAEEPERRPEAVEASQPQEPRASAVEQMRKQHAELMERLMAEQEAERQAAQQAAARDAALAYKQQMAREEKAAAAHKKAQHVAQGSASPRQQPLPSQQQQQQRRRTTTTTAISSTTSVPKRAAAPTSRGLWSLVYVVLVACVVIVGLFAAAAVIEDAIAPRKSSISSSSLPLHVAAVTRSLWRRVRRAFSAARKQLTGHGSDLPMSVNEGTGPVARAVAAASSFLHVFWAHLVEHRGQHLSSAVAAAVEASRRASNGGFAPDRSSFGGAPSSPFASAQYQQASPFSMEADLRRRH